MGRKGRTTASKSISVASNLGNKKDTMVNSSGKKRAISVACVNNTVSRKTPKRVAAGTDFKEKSVHLSEKSNTIEVKQDMIMDEEQDAVRLTGSLDAKEPRPNRKLADFIFHDINGNPQPFEMSEVADLYITALILPLEEPYGNAKEGGIRCEGFGRIEEWSISGYEDGYPVVWVSTDLADYNCAKPAGSYKKFFDYFYDKARICVEVFQKLSPVCGGNPNISVDELLAAVIRSMSKKKLFHGGTLNKDFIVSQGDFIYRQLIGLDDTSKQNDLIFTKLPVLLALRDGSMGKELDYNGFLCSNGSLKINCEERRGQGQNIHQSDIIEDADEDEKLARLLQEDEYRKSMTQLNRKTLPAKRYYVKISEDEIANDYPLPAYYKPCEEEMDEYLVFDDAGGDLYPDELPRSMLHNWSLYNSESRIISLELLPMKPGAEVDVRIFGSGSMTHDDGTWLNIEDTPSQSSSSGEFTNKNSDGVPIYLSAIKEWMIEFGSSMISISIRTDMAWYRLGKPSKQYAPWYKPVIKTAKVAVCIITLLKEQSRASKLSFGDVIKKVADLEKNHPAYISSNANAVERYIVVHGQIILQQFSEYPDEMIRRCAFVTGLSDKMEERHHIKLLMKTKALVKKEQNMNPRASMAPVLSKRKAMRATTTKLINGIWSEYYSTHFQETLKGAELPELKEEEDSEEENENEDPEDVLLEQSNTLKEITLHSKISKLKSTEKESRWEGKSAGKMPSGERLYKSAVIGGEIISVAGAVLLDSDGGHGGNKIIFVEYLYEKLNGMKMLHGRVMLKGSNTVLGNAANEREVFLTNKCNDFELSDIKQCVTVEIKILPWGHQHRKVATYSSKVEAVKAEERRKKGLPMEYYCKASYWPEQGAFVDLPWDTLGLGNGDCHSCKCEDQGNEFRVSPAGDCFFYRKKEYHILDFVYVAPSHFSEEQDMVTFKAGRNVGLKSYVVCHLLEIRLPESSEKVDAGSVQLKLRRFFKPEDISSEKAYGADIREVYYSEVMTNLAAEKIEGKCEVRRKHHVPAMAGPALFDHVFFCEYIYNPSSGSFKQLPASVKLSTSYPRLTAGTLLRKSKGKFKTETEDQMSSNEIEDGSSESSRLATLDIFAGCGGLSEGLQNSGASVTKWAIEYEQAAADAFKLNHPNAFMFNENCNVILKAIMDKYGDGDDCVATSEAAERAAALSGEMITNLPSPGQVDFINGGPPCQGFSGMNRFSESTWSKVQCEMILAFLSFADYFRPRFFLLENVRNFVSFNKGQTFRLTVASLLEMGYQVRFGILEAGAYGVSQSRKRAFIWAAAPREMLPDWPEPMNVFASPELKISLPGGVQYSAVKSTADGAPFRSITVKDTIGDLPRVGNGASNPEIEYTMVPVSWFQKQIRGSATILYDHISKEMNELNYIRCQKIPKWPGADWHNLPKEKVKLSSGEVVDLIPWCLPNTADRNNQWKGLYGRLDWNGNFPTSTTDPQPMGKVGMCFHPDQDRILTVRECARSQGFSDSYRFSGNIQNKHRQIGNAVPPPLALALGMKLKQAIYIRKNEPIT